MSCGDSSFSKGQLNLQPRHCCISHELLKAATSDPSKIAVIHSTSSVGDRNSTCSTPPVYEGDQCFTFSTILNSVHQLSRRLRFLLDAAGKSSHGEQCLAGVDEPFVSFMPRLGQVSDDRTFYRPKIVGLYMPPSVEYIISVFSVLRCGEAFLPLDPSWPEDRILSTISSSDADLIITRASSFSKAGVCELSEQNWLVENGFCPVFCFSMEESLEEHVSPLPLVWPCEKEKQRLFCYLMYTSGSTGQPKGVCGTEQGLFNRFLWMQEAYPVNGNEVLLFKTSLSFIDHLQEFLGAVLTASTLVIPPFNLLRKDPFSLVNFLQVYSVDRLIAVPSLVRTILPALRSQYSLQTECSLKLLVLSGEVFPLPLFNVLSNLLPNTTILNLYGSTEVAGDCTYFDCKRLSMISDAEALTSVPIGVPISNCNVILVGETDMPNQGEICVGGPCVSFDFNSKSSIMSLNYVKVHENCICSCVVDNCGYQVYYKTGDFAQRLQCGNLVFLGRIDRIVKLNGQRIALEEIENAVREHPDVLDAAVIAHESPAELLHLEAFLTLKDDEKSDDLVKSIRNLMVRKLPSAMVPSHFVVVESLPLSSSGKVDYALLAGSSLFLMHDRGTVGRTNSSDFLHSIKKAFCDALMVQDFPDDVDFFMMGGSSVTAAQLSYNLGVDMRMIYKFPTPYELHKALLNDTESFKVDARTDISWESNLKALSSNRSQESQKRVIENLHQNNDQKLEVSKRLKVDKHISSECTSLNNGTTWYASIPNSCAFTRCNKILFEREYKLRDSYESTLSSVVLKGGISMRGLWKVHMDSCVDASPLLVSKGQDVYLFIGSHARKFVCVNAKCGSIVWEVRLQGRIECSAALVDDFSQVVVGCYDGRIYFLDFINGNIHWTFQTGAEVKCQPFVDVCRQLIWCGSHDHYLYALDYRSHCCIYRVSCGGSVFGSPAIDEERETIYVASTSGRVTAISLKALPFPTLWQRELEVPIFGSLLVGSPHGNIICCLVDGNIVSLDAGGSIIWKYRTGGPIFAGTCTSVVLPSQVLACSRNGSVYSFEMERGNLLWEYNVGDPVTSSAYVDEHMQLVSEFSHVSKRLVCLCTSSGRLLVLCVNLGKENENVVEEVSSMELAGDIFSSPVMLCGRIFVGCRDDYVHCISLESQCSKC